MNTTPIWPIAGAPTSGPNPTPNLIALVNYYVGLLLKQYSTLPNAQRTIAIFSKAVICDDLTTQVLNGFNLDTAVGAQLDIIGKYIGQDRLLGGGTITPLDFFGCVDSTNTLQNDYGLTDTTQSGVNADVLFIGTGGSVQQSTALPDSQYRTVLQLKALLNTSDGTLAEVQQALWDTYGIPGYFTLSADPALPSTSYFTPNVVGGVIVGVTVHPSFQGLGFTPGAGPYVYFPGGTGAGALGQCIISNSAPHIGTIIGVNMILSGSGYTAFGTPVAFSSTLVQCVDNANMSVTYNVLPSVPISKANLELFLPKPMGSSITVNTY